MDNVWSYETDTNLVYYEPYNSYFPCKQVMLLQLYDHLGLPYINKKQLFGSALEIIGLHMDPASMTITMPLAA